MQERKPCVLLEGVADRDWGIAFSVVNDRINKGKFVSDLFIFTKWHSYPLLH